MVKKVICVMQKIWPQLKMLLPPMDAGLAKSGHGESGPRYQLYN